MNEYVSVRTLQFLLHEVFGIDQITEYEHFQDYDAEAFDMTLEAAKQLADTHLFPLYREMDKNKAYFKDGVVHVHPKLKAAIDAIGEAGFISARNDYDEEGQQMPAMLKLAAQLILFAANANIAAYATLTEGSANLIRTFGSDELKQTYSSRMFTGEWQGTMALTEPQAGSSLSDITTSATPNEDGSYHIRGQKIYISGGDYESAGNVIHLTLAKIDGAPAGAKGISLFVVPKFRDKGGELIDNNVTTAGIYGKMGQKGYVAAHLMMGEQGDTVGYLVGEPHRGLRYMWQMMNEARIGTGTMAAATASAAYYASLKYAHERPQGRHPSNKNPEEPMVLIIEHADVRRMLLQQKATVEGSFALLTYCSQLVDISERSPNEDERKNAHLLLELLTPVAKSFPSEYGNIAVSTGMQVLGGAGYTDDFPLEQHFRDIRVNSIYEGTTTIHGMDLLGRKIPMANGKPLMLLGQEVQKTIEAAMANDALSGRALELGKSVQTLQETTMRLLQLGQSETPEVFLADATIYLDYFSLVTVGWLWLKQGITAAEKLAIAESDSERNFYQGKLAAMHFFFEYELPRTRAHHARLKSVHRVTLETEGSWLN